MSQNPLRCPKCHLCNLMKLPWGEWKCPSCSYILGSPVTQDYIGNGELSQNEKTFEEAKLKAAKGDSESMISIVALLDCSDSDLRRKIESFLLYHKQYSIEIIMDALKSPSHLKKNVLIKVLGNFRDERAVRPLISLLKKSPIEIKEQVILSLGIIGDKKAVLPLIQQINNSNITIKKTAIEALLHIDDERAIVPLTEAIDSAPRKAKCEIIGLLANIYDEKSVNCLLKQLETSDPDIQKKSVQSLITNKKTLPIMKKYNVAQNFEPLEVIINCFLRSEDNVTSENFELLLIKLKDISVHQLINKIDGSTSIEKCKIIHLLLKMDIDELPTELPLHQLSMCPDKIQIDIIQALGKNNNIIASKPLINLLQLSNNRNVQNACVNSIIKINDASTFPLITKLLDSYDNNTRKNAETIIIGLRIPKISDELIEQRKKAIEENKKIQIAQKKQNEEKKRIQIEQKKQNDEKKRIRSGVIRQYDPKVNDPRIKKILIDSKSRDRKLRSEAISDLRYIHSSDAMAALIRISNYKDPIARNLAIKILGKRQK